ncbi:MAG: DUF3187 family protein [Candidatus Brocadiaceae bacterium]|nr:DUF3187 family protein [Candidatus Brocadiaceae bacterium]
MMKQHCLILWALLLAGNVVASANQTINEPFHTANRTPLIMVYGLPDSESARLAEEGKFKFGFFFDAINTFSSSNIAGHQIRLDGETYRANFKIRYGVSERWEFGIDMPYVAHDGGSMDGLIEGFHEIFGLDNTNRELYTRDNLLYSYIENGHQLLRIDRSMGGVGDVRLSAAYMLSKENNRQWSLRTGLKLPTGDAEKLTGTGSTDISLSLHMSESQWLTSPALTLHASAGVLLMGDGEVLPTIRKDWAMFASSTVSWLWTEGTSLKAQIDAHSSMYDGDIRELGRDSMQLVLGASFEMTEKTTIDFSISEDLIVNTAPDVVFQIAYKYTP